jgi:nucleoside diphosphate kinase
MSQKASGVYVINGFYMAMREKYTKDGASIHYALVEWDESTLSWADFRGRVLGATDPATAAEGSARRAIYDDWASLGLAAQPDVGDNGVHASASPFEALCERLNWVGAKLESDPFGAALLAAGIPKETILAWTKDPQVSVNGKNASLFDTLEDLSVSACLAKAKEIAGVSGATSLTKNSAFVFIKPHAVNDKCVALLKQKLTAAGITITSEGTLSAKTIEQNLLIDNHYYAIANKASLSKPAQLNVPASKQAEFATKFGITWEQALADGLVFNALDACQHLGIGGDELNTRWAAAKDAGLLVKFGGGFYAGRVAA